MTSAVLCCGETDSPVCLQLLCGPCTWTEGREFFGQKGLAASVSTHPTHSHYCLPPPAALASNPHPAWLPGESAVHSTLCLLYRRLLVPQSGRPLTLPLSRDCMASVHPIAATWGKLGDVAKTPLSCRTMRWRDSPLPSGASTSPASHLPSLPGFGKEPLGAKARLGWKLVGRVSVSWAPGPSSWEEVGTAWGGWSLWRSLLKPCCSGSENRAPAHLIALFRALPPLTASPIPPQETLSS